MPAIAITYGGNKGNGIMKDMDLSEYAIKIGELTFENLKDKFESLEKEREQVINKEESYIKQCNIKYNKLIEEIKRNI